MMKSEENNMGATDYTGPYGAAEQLPLTGRDEELARIDAILLRRRPALVIVTAAAESGKTSLLQMVAARSIERGWRAVSGDHEGMLYVSSTTTEESFCERVLTLLGVSPQSDVGTTARDRSGLNSPNSLMDLIRELGEAARGRRGHRSFELLVEQLRRTPVVILIDGYRPNPEFASWFAARFFEGIKDTRAPIVVVVADQLNNVGTLRPFADEVINLGPLSLQAVKKHFELLGRQMVPPPEEPELEVYAQAACEEPAILASLTRTLALARPTEGSRDMNKTNHED